MIHAETHIENETVEVNSIDILENTNLVKAFFTTNRLSSWKYGNGNWQDNYSLLAEQLKISPTEMCTTYQTHTSVVRLMTSENKSEGILKPTQVQDYDGIITNEKNLLLCSFEADCVPVYFLDPVNKAIGLSHSGWKGTAKEISKTTVTAMTEKFSTKPENLIVVIGPCACEKCYEVGSELIEQFKAGFENEIEKIFIPNSNGKYNLDLKAAIEITLLKSGVNSSNIYSVDRCTIESPDLCSFRRTKSTTDHMLTAIMLK